MKGSVRQFFRRISICNGRIETFPFSWGGTGEGSAINEQKLRKVFQKNSPNNKKSVFQFNYYKLFLLL